MESFRLFLQDFLALFLFAIIIVTSGVTIKCSLPDDSVPSFRWNSGAPYFIDESNNKCDLLVNISSIQQDIRTMNVLSFGDSYELHLCGARPSGLNNSNYQFIQLSSESKYLFVKCSRDNEPITYMVRRVFGQNGAPNQSWQNGHQTSVQIISEMGHYFSTTPTTVNGHHQQHQEQEHNQSDTKRSDKPLIEKIDAVVFGSFLWDLKHWHTSWCLKILGEATNRSEVNVTESLHIEFCKHVKLSSTSVTPNSTQSMDVETILQSWGRMTVPWCDAATLLNWQQTYFREVRALLAAFPQAVLFLRTQPISSAVFLGNEHCHGPMNAFILQVWATYQHLQLQNANGTTIGRRVRLIAMHELFEAPNDNGVDHFYTDNIHLTKDGDKVYRDYVMRVLDEFRRSSSQ